jgi:hypothetical protein
MIFILTLLASLAEAAFSPRPIPRTSTRLFVDQGVFEGGSPLAANIEGIRFSRNPKDNSERWVIDFSDARTRSLQQLAPEFQIRFSPMETFITPEGKSIILSHPRLIISLSSIKGNYLHSPQLTKLLRKSKLVRQVRIYPPIEDGDRAIEFVLKKKILFEPHQPLQKEGRLVLDLKPKK